MNRTGKHPTLWLLMVLPLGLALLIYHPWAKLPLDIWDFREFLPILQRTSGAWHRFTALLGYYAHHGRTNPLFYATFVMQYSWFGIDAGGWQCLRVVWMSLDLFLVVFLCRRIGLHMAAGIAAAMVLVTASPAVRAWVQLMAEPQALAAILAAACIGTTYRSTDRWQRAACWITLLVAAAFLSKEVVGSLGTVVFLIAVAWNKDDDEPLIARRHIVLGSALLLVVAAEALLLHTIRAQPEATGYGMAYGSGALSLGRFGANLLAIMLPVRPGADAALGMLYPANVAAILVLVLGLTTRLRRRPADACLAVVVSAGVLPAIIGAAVYLPWPKFDSFYALPFFVGPLLLYAAAIDELLTAGGIRRAFAVIAIVVVPGYAAIAANRSVESAAASLRLNADLARLSGRFAHGDTLLVLSPPQGPRGLPVAANELREYGATLGWIDTTRAAAFLAAPCDRYTPTTDVTAPGGPVFVSYSYGCGRLPNATLQIVSEFAWRDWHTLAAVHDTMTLSFAGAAVRELMHKPAPKP